MSQRPALPTSQSVIVREAQAREYAAIGQLLVTVYAGLPGFPSPDEQPRYYEMLRQIGQVAERPGAQLLVAAEGEMLLGAVVYFGDMAQYGSGGTATQETDAAGFRLLAVVPSAQGRGVGGLLIERCLELAREQGRRQVILHSTAAMQTAWAMYERRGFVRATELDFMQGELAVFGFRLGFD